LRPGGRGARNRHNRRPATAVRILAAPGLGAVVHSRGSRRLSHYANRRHLGAIGRFALRFRWLVLLAWIAAAIAAATQLPSLASVTQSNNSKFLPASAPSEHGRAWRCRPGPARRGAAAVRSAGRPAQRVFAGLS
jgi:hypothetical protein